MPVITKIEPQKKRKERYNIYLDGKFTLGLDAETLLKTNLRTGQELDGAALDRLVAEAQYERLLNRALNFISFRPRSEKEIVNYLRQSGRKLKYENTEILAPRVLEKLADLNLINDQQFADWWVDQRRSGRTPFGARRIKSELLAKGLSSPIIEKALAVGGVDEFSLAEAAAEKKAAVYAKLDNRTYRLKMSQFLARRGFSWETIKRIVDNKGKTA